MKIITGTSHISVGLTALQTANTKTKLAHSRQIFKGKKLQYDTREDVMVAGQPVIISSSGLTLKS